MIDSGKEFANSVGAVPAHAVTRTSRSYLQLGLGVLIALAGCGVLASVWRVSADENRRQAIAAIRALGQAQSSALRIDAIQELVRPAVIDGRLAVRPLIRSLADPAVEVRIAAARSLGPAASAAAMDDSGDDQVIAAIAALTDLLDDSEPDVRIAAVHALGSIAASNNPSRVIQPQTLVDALAVMLADPDRIVRASAIASLGVAGPVAAPIPPPALVAALNDESSFNRAATVHSLARFPQGVERNISALLGVLEKEQHESPVRVACVEVLRQITPERVTAAK